MKSTDISRKNFERYLRRDEVSGCLLWTGSRSADGYGRFGVRRKNRLAHRVAFVLAGGEITHEKPHVLHNCPGGDNPACCEPAHLWAGTHDENQKDKARKGRGRKGDNGYPFGVSHLPSGRYLARSRVDGAMRCFGTYGTWQEAAAIAIYEKNIRLFPDTRVN